MLLLDASRLPVISLLKPQFPTASPHPYPHVPHGPPPPSTLTNPQSDTTLPSATLSHMPTPTRPLHRDGRTWLVNNNNMDTYFYRRHHSNAKKFYIDNRGPGKKATYHNQKQTCTEYTLNIS